MKFNLKLFQTILSRCNKFLEALKRLIHLKGLKQLDNYDKFVHVWTILILLEQIWSISDKFWPILRNSNKSRHQIFKNFRRRAWKNFKKAKKFEFWGKDTNEKERKSDNQSMLDRSGCKKSCQIRSVLKPDWRFICFAVKCQHDKCVQSQPQNIDLCAI